MARIGANAASPALDTELDSHCNARHRFGAGLLVGKFIRKGSLPTPLNQPLAANQDADRREQAERQVAALWKKFEEETLLQIQGTEAGAAAAKLHEEALTKELQVPPRAELARPRAVPMQPGSPARADKNPDTERQRSMPALQAQVEPTAPRSAPPRVMEREPPPATPSHLQQSWHASRDAQPVPAAPAVNSAPTSSVTGRLPGTPAMLSVLPGEPSDVVPGQDVHQVLPEVPRKALDTIQGTIRVRVKVRADPSGSVVVVSLDSPGPSRYFAELALQAARRWKFSPARNSQDVSREWILQFEFAKGATRVSPVYIARPTAR